MPEGWYVCARTNRLRETAARAMRSAPPEDDPSSSPLQVSMPTYAPFLSHRDNGSLGSRSENLLSFSPTPSSPSSATPPLSSSSSSPSSAGPSLHRDPHPATPPHFPPPPPSHHDRGIRLVPLEELQSHRHRRRDPTDEIVLRSLNAHTSLSGSSGTSMDTID